MKINPLYIAGELIHLSDVCNTLSELEAFGILKIKEINDNQTKLKPGEFQKIVVAFRQEINGKLLLSEIQRIRLVHKGLGRMADDSAEHARNIMNITMMNIGEEKQAVENSRNSCIAICSTWMAGAAVLLAFVSAVFAMLSFLFAG